MCLMAKSKFNERLVLCVKARKVRDLVKGLDHKVLKGNIDTEVSDVVFDSRKATKDTIYKAIGALNEKEMIILRRHMMLDAEHL